MSNHIQHDLIRGQALVEMVVALPLLIIFMAIAAPLIINSTAVYWLEERLYLRQLLNDDEQINHLLFKDRKADMLPPYFDRTSLEETTFNRSTNTLFRIPNTPFPGDLIKHETVCNLSDTGWWDAILFSNNINENLQLQRTLAKVEASELHESQVAGMIERLTVAGFVPGVTKTLEKLGYELFHINLNALPHWKPERSTP